MANRYYTPRRHLNLQDTLVAVSVFLIAAGMMWLAFSLKSFALLLGSLTAILLLGGFLVNARAETLRHYNVEMMFELLLNGVYESELRSDRIEVRQLLSQSKEFLRQASNISDSAHRARIFLEVADLERRGNKLLNDIEENLIRTRDLRQKVARMKDKERVFSEEQKRLLQEATFINRTRYEMESLSLFFKRTQEYAREGM